MVKPEPAPEFSHIIPLSEIGAAAKPRRIAANEAERAALAKRFALLSLDRLEADVALVPEGKNYIAEGRLWGDAVQACVASGAAVPARVEENFRICFAAEARFDEEAEIELDADECDTLFHDGRTIDLGEAVAQSFALALDPFPRSPNADAVLKAAGVKEEGEAGPFGALAALKDKLGKS
jgi:uncharacterized metal-binding protein YceD (DUF177 family)